MDPQVDNWYAGPLTNGASRNAAAGWIADVCANLPYALFLVESNRKVRAHLGRQLPTNFPVRVQGGRLELPPAIQRRVSGLLSAEVDSGPALIRVQDPGSTTVEMVFERIPLEVSPVLWRTAIFPESGLAPTIEALRLVYRMTPSEARVVRQLTAGRCLRTAAQHLGISHETARVHLKGAFLKANVRCQAGLVARVLSGPALVLGQHCVGQRATEFY